MNRCNSFLEYPELFVFSVIHIFAVFCDCCICLCIFSPETPPMSPAPPTPPSPKVAVTPPPQGPSPMHREVFRCFSYLIFRCSLMLARILYTNVYYAFGLLKNLKFCIFHQVYIMITGISFL